MKRTAEFTILLTETHRYPYVRARMLGPRSRAKVGELEVPVSLTFDTRWLQQRTGRIEAAVQEPPQPTLQVGEPTP